MYPVDLLHTRAIIQRLKVNEIELGGITHNSLMPRSGILPSINNAQLKCPLAGSCNTIQVNQNGINVLLVDFPVSRRVKAGMAVLANTLIIILQCLTPIIFSLQRQLKYEVGANSTPQIPYSGLTANGYTYQCAGASKENPQGKNEY